MAKSGIEVRGLDGLAHLSRKFAEAGEQGRGLRRELTKGISSETLRTRRDMRAAIRPALPQSGGLADDVLRSTRFGTKVQTGGNNVGVRILARGRRGIRRMNLTGSVRHPVFGNRDVWVTQLRGIKGGFLDRPFEQARPELQAAVLGAIARVRGKIEG